jgi:hypothetical protein
MIDKYPNYQDLARWEYGRMLWKIPRLRERLVRHWTDERHPYRHRFACHRAVLERMLAAPANCEDRLDAELQLEGLSLRGMIREIPPVFGAFWGDSQTDIPGER